MNPAFANLLLTGPCNLRCPHCIGGRLPRDRTSTLGTFPLPGLDRFIHTLREKSVSEVSVTGVDTEPLLYRHTHKLLARLRENLPAVRLSLHTNGTLALHRLSRFHAYDRATVSFPSQDAETTRRITGSPRVVDIASLFQRSRIPIKLSILLTEHNRDEIPSLLAFIRSVGCRRAVLRHLYGEPSPSNPLPHHQPVRSFGANPVYDLDGLEVTVWDFRKTRLPCVNLFPDGSIRVGYELTDAVEV
jgi:MoaA/NifB/PqqE/SkfB family radical SAM enzyme